MEPVLNWADIAANFVHGLILGNGASIAFDQRFDYRSLKEYATDHGLITADVQRVFDHLNTGDFELVLRMLWHAQMINEALDIQDARTTQAYISVRDALIATVHAIHVSHAEVRTRLAAAATFMSHFSTVASLSYDLLVYWAVLVGNEATTNRLKDCFLHGEFHQDWRLLREPYPNNTAATLVFYPHGCLALGADLYGRESKIHAGDASTLLDTIFDRWAVGAITPIFVSEGTSSQKVAAIRRSPYLTTVYEEVLPELGDSVVVFGWSLHERDDHLLDAICLGPVHRLAVAVNPTAPTLAEFQATVRRKLGERLGQGAFELVFFDRGSQGCWIAT
jgi:hypothetical protein